MKKVACSSVHPRTGGERDGFKELTAPYVGSSPHGRGTQRPAGIARLLFRFIPARAGNASTCLRGGESMAVHPRTGGERRSVTKKEAPHTGSSPHGRGTLRSTACRLPSGRFIPARAGNAGIHRQLYRQGPVHPRTGGERPERFVSPSSIRGSSPHGRGTRSCRDPPSPDNRFIPARAGNALNSIVFRASTSVHPRTGGERGSTTSRMSPISGSSPHGRGTPLPHEGRPPLSRFIPARAGNAAPLPLRFRQQPVHPRTGGERIMEAEKTYTRTGSSPHGRGTRTSSPLSHLSRRFIPARAGNADSLPGCLPQGSVHPRTGGERRLRASSIASCCGSSPHGRGTPERLKAEAPGRRFIPARAGNAPAAGRLRCACSVHPRTGGERVLPLRYPMDNTGSSPHGRGTRPQLNEQALVDRFIPARAGNASATAVAAAICAVHPRTGGERSIRFPEEAVHAGSSPHGRGTRGRHKACFAA